MEEKTIYIILGVVVGLIVLMIMFRMSMTSGAAAPTQANAAQFTWAENFGSASEYKEDIDCIEDPTYAPCSTPHKGYFWPNDYNGSYSGAANYTDDGTYTTYATPGGN
jgi:hypothetical protein